jgi:hypothetical protein
MQPWFLRFGRRDGVGHKTIIGAIRGENRHPATSRTSAPPVIARPKAPAPSQNSSPCLRSHPPTS